MLLIADIAASCHPEGTVHQQWYHHGGRNNIICITGAMAFHRVYTKEYPVWTALEQEPVQTSCESVCSRMGLSAAAPW